MYRFKLAWQKHLTNLILMIFPRELTGCLSQSTQRNQSDIYGICSNKTTTEHRQTQIELSTSSLPSATRATGGPPIVGWLRPLVCDQCQCQCQCQLQLHANCVGGFTRSTKTAALSVTWSLVWTSVAGAILAPIRYLPAVFGNPSTSE